MSTRATVLAGTLERAINTALQYDPGTQVALGDLKGKTLAVQCTSPALSLYFLINEQHIAVKSHHEDTCHCKLTGDLTALATVAFKGTTSLADTDVYIEGNPGVLSQLLEILKQLDIDWEEALGDRFGSIPGHFLSECINQNNRWLKTRAKQIPGYVKEVLTEELKLVPSSGEADEFYQALNTLRSDTARLAARITHLQSGR